MGCGDVTGFTTKKKLFRIAGISIFYNKHTHHGNLHVDENNINNDIFIFMVR